MNIFNETYLACIFIKKIEIRTVSKVLRRKYLRLRNSLERIFKIQINYIAMIPIDFCEFFRSLGNMILKEADLIRQEFVTMIDILVEIHFECFATAKNQEPQESVILKNCPCVHWNHCLL